MRQRRGSLNECRKVLVHGGPLLLAILLASPFLAGCARLVFTSALTAPNSGKRINPIDDPPCTEALGRTCSQSFRVEVGPPKARLLVRILEPQNLPPSEPPRATILVVHGWAKDMREAAPMARLLCDSGYRSVLVDMRGHGGSTGDWTTFGVTESVDLSQVVDELEFRGLVAGRLGAYGISMGAATELEWAAFDDRVRALVSVSSFASAAYAGVRLFRIMVPFYGWVAPGGHLESELAAAARDAGFDVAQASPEVAVSSVKASVLLIHGTRDRRVIPENAERIKERAPKDTRLVWIKGMGHNSEADPDGLVSRATLEWFERWLASPDPGSAVQPDRSPSAQ